MLAAVNAEALSRIATAHAVLRTIAANESMQGSSPPGIRAMKGLVFVQNYGAYEYIVSEAVYALIRSVNQLKIPLVEAHSNLLALALNPQFDSVIQGSIHKTWEARSTLLKGSRSLEFIEISDDLIPKDGSHFRPRQLQTIWDTFGIKEPILPELRLRGRIDEMVENRNKIAHGNDAPEQVGRGDTSAELKDRIDDTETIISYIVATINSYVRGSGAFRNS